MRNYKNEIFNAINFTLVILRQPSVMRKINKYDANANRIRELHSPGETYNWETEWREERIQGGRMVIERRFYIPIFKFIACFGPAHFYFLRKFYVLGHSVVTEKK